MTQEPTNVNEVSPAQPAPAQDQDQGPPRLVMAPRLPIRVMLGIPAYNSLCLGSHVGILQHGLGDGDEIFLRHSSISSLTHNFNVLWAQALDARDAGKITHFAMLHADIVPVPGWLDGLARLMAPTDYRVISAISPIKDARGLTSTALDTDRWRPRRLSNVEVMSLPLMFSSSSAISGLPPPHGPLLINTGCMLCDLRPHNGVDWARQIVFEFRNAMTVDSKTGKYFPLFEPEDWRFSRRLHQLQVPYAATRAIPLAHDGSWLYTATAPGMMETDTQNIPSAGASVELIAGE